MKRQGTLGEQVFNGTGLGKISRDQVLLNVEVVGWRPDGMQKRGVQVIDGPPAFHLGELAGLERAVRVADEDEGPIGSVGVLLVRVVAGVDDKRIVHHVAIALRHRFEFLDHLGQHAAIVLTNLDPDLVVRLRHVT